MTDSKQSASDTDVTTKDNTPVSDTDVTTSSVERISDETRPTVDDELTHELLGCIATEDSKRTKLKQLMGVE